MSHPVFQQVRASMDADRFVTRCLNAHRRNHTRARAHTQLPAGPVDGCKPFAQICWPCAHSPDLSIECRTGHVDALPPAYYRDPEPVLQHVSARQTEALATCAMFALVQQSKASRQHLRYHVSV